MSESQQRDEQRTLVKETIKRRLVRLYRTALAGGTRHAEYLQLLGMPHDRIFLGYDIVDNDYFQAGAEAARQDATHLRAKYLLPEKYFLASSRFIPKKNLPMLVRAFALYRRMAGHEAWDLVILGDGPGKEELLILRDELQLRTCLHLPGFQQYPVLPVYYGLAAAFVHASLVEQWGLVVNEAMAAGLPVVVSDACGCAHDLVEPGDNGATFDPKQPDRLAHQLHGLTKNPAALPRMGGRSQQIIANWGRQRFALGLQQATALAMQLGPVPPRLGDRPLLYLLSRR